MTYQYDVMRPWPARCPHRPLAHKTDIIQGLPIIDKHDTDTETKPDESKGCFDSFRKNLFFIGTSAIITKLLGFNEASWWLVLLPFLCTVQITANSFRYGQTSRISQSIEGWSSKGCPSRRKPSRHRN